MRVAAPIASTFYCVLLDGSSLLFINGPRGFVLQSRYFIGSGLSGGGRTWLEEQSFPRTIRPHRRDKSNAPIGEAKV